MIPVSQTDVQTALERALTDPEVAKLIGRVQKASDLVEGYLGLVYADSDTVPPVVVRVTAGAVARLYQRDSNSTPVPLFQDSKTADMGPFNATIKFSQDVTSGDPWLTKADKMRLTNIFSGYQTMDMASDRGCPPVAGS